MSFACPKCGKPTMVRDTRYNKSTNQFPEGFMRRRRACIKCKRRFTTMEMVAVLRTGMPGVKGRSTSAPATVNVAVQKEKVMLAKALRTFARQLERERVSPSE